MCYRHSCWLLLLQSPEPSRTRAAPGQRTHDIPSSKNQPEYNHEEKCTTFTIIGPVYVRQRLCPASSNGHRAGRRDRRTDGRRERDRAGNHQRNHDRHPRPLRHKRQKPPVRPDLLVYRHGTAEHHGRQQHRSAGRTAAGCDPDRERRRADRLRRRPEEKRRRLAGRAEHVRDHQIEGHELYGCAPRPHGRRAGQLQFGRTRCGHRHYDPRR